MKSLISLIFFCAAGPCLAAASSVDALKALLQQTTTARAHFAQMVLDKNLTTLQQATGTMQFSRPGKFRWEYDKPHEQLIVSDGAKVWLYDNNLDKDYTLTALGNQDGLDWLEALPRTPDTAFEKIRLGFGKSGLEAMELRDQFGQVTVIKFSTIERNPKLPPETFRFTPPKGADVISE
jgi:outer membrane lipoprotein carrier protein